MNRQKIQATLLVSALMLAGACGNNQGTSSSSSSKAPGSRVERWKEDAKDALTTTTAYLVQQKEQLQRSLTDRMNDFDQRLSDLKAKPGRFGDQAKAEWSKTLVQLQQKKQLATEKLEQLKNSSADKWQEFKSGAEAAVADLEKELKEAFARSKENDQSSGK